MKSYQKQRDFGSFWEWLPPAAAMAALIPVSSLVHSSKLSVTSGIPCCIEKYPCVAVLQFDWFWFRSSSLTGFDSGAVRYFRDSLLYREVSLCGCSPVWLVLIQELYHVQITAYFFLSGRFQSFKQETSCWVMLNRSQPKDSIWFEFCIMGHSPIFYFFRGLFTG